ncbi:hypothetical protein LPB87_01415 [Flavobacterium sp. EDS]|uniref:hypothetical protein n=1 Tax=Flavobacterium sp. EDS TaxID=2897328 RepID=UPI001E61CD5F|nr:hypothetical protein [Flavobacterium sp. EDS]MCD0473045.1 hypothetical protein [Flavobacterium sp. EDS]
MKKNLLCLFSALLVLVSCSSDVTREDEIIDDIPTPVGQILLTKMIEKNAKGITRTIINTYAGNKIVSQVYNNTKEGIYYTYTGDLITKMEFKLADGTVEQINTYKYDGNKKLIEFFRTQPGQEDWDTKDIFVYNADGTVSVYDEDGFKNSTITFLNGEVSEVVSENSPNFKYTYDTKNNPFKNVLGMDKIAFIDGEGNGVLHNIISETSSFGDETTTTTSKITYNADGYPVKSFDNFEDAGTTTEYFY